VVGWLHGRCVARDRPPLSGLPNVGIPLAATRSPLRTRRCARNLGTTGSSCSPNAGWASLQLAEDMLEAVETFHLHPVRCTGCTPSGQGRGDQQRRWNRAGSCSRIRSPCGMSADVPRTYMRHTWCAPRTERLSMRLDPASRAVPEASRPGRPRSAPRTTPTGRRGPSAMGRLPARAR
jgi:hypothetical protein